MLRRGFKFESIDKQSSNKKIFQDCELVIKYSSRKQRFILEIHEINSNDKNLNSKTRKLVFAIKKDLDPKLLQAK